MVADRPNPAPSDRGAGLRRVSRSRSRPQTSSWSSSVTSYHSSSWSSAPSTVNWASSSPAAAGRRRRGRGARPARRPRRPRGSRPRAASAHRHRHPHDARTQFVAPGRIGRRQVARETPPGAGAPPGRGQQLQRVLRGPGERDVLELLLVALGVPLAQLGRDGVAAALRRGSRGRPSARSRASSGTVAGRYTRVTFSSTASSASPVDRGVAVRGTPIRQRGIYPRGPHPSNRRQTQALGIRGMVAPWPPGS